MYRQFGMKGHSVDLGMEASAEMEWRVAEDGMVHYYLCIY